MSAISKTEFEAILATELPWAAASGIEVDQIASSEACLRLPFDESSLRPGGTISGPAMMMLADACMYAVVLSSIGAVKLAVTTNLNINFLRKPAETDLLAKGSMIKLGKRLAVMEVSIVAEVDGEIVAHATGTYSIPPRG